MSAFRIVTIVTAAVLGLTTGPLAAQTPLGTGLTYQGQLKQGGSAVNGAMDLQFSLWDAAANGSQIGMTQTLIAVPVSEGLFAVEINAGGEFGLPADLVERQIDSSGCHL